MERHTDYETEYFVENGKKMVKVFFKNKKFRDVEQTKIKMISEGYEVFTEDSVTDQVKELENAVNLAKSRLPVMPKLSKELIVFKSKMDQIKKYDQALAMREQFQEPDLMIKEQAPKIESSEKMVKKWQRILRGFKDLEVPQEK